jgi:cytochrome c biogenesis protein CcmG, thiol:disulfide interchange protein DsbE
MRMTRFLIPLAVLIVLVVFLAIGLELNPREVPSPLIDKPAPAFQLTRLDDPARTVTLEELRGQVWLLNVWASWCVACLQEHPVLVEFSRSGTVPIYGLNYKDKPDAAAAWLGKHGNPYTVSIVDADGRVGIDYGVYGVPETFLIDKQGVIRYKHIGPVTPDVLNHKILPLVRKLQA